MNDYNRVALGELAASGSAAMSTGPFGSSIGSSTFRSAGVPVIRGGNLSADISTRLDDRNLVFIEPELAAMFRRSAVVEGDIIFTCWGTINQVGILDKRAAFPSYIISNKQMKFTADRNKVNPMFLYYYFSGPEGQADIISGGIGSSVPGFNLGQLRRMRVPLPPLQDQNEIVLVLSMLDDKIDLNRRMNEKLDAMARAIFKDWFVDFGPTRAKMAGRLPYLDPDIWALFPACLDGEEMPNGWPKQRVDDLMELGYGKSLPANVRVHGDYPVYGSGGISGFHNEALLSAPSVIVGRKGTVGSVYWEDRPCFPIDTVFYVSPHGAPLSFSFYLLSYLGLSEMNTDAAVPGLNRNNVHRLSGSWGNAIVRRCFDETVTPLRRMMFSNIEETRSLVGIRDLLLPKLMSGDVRVLAAKKALEAGL